ncbi:tetraspanin-4-like isoform X1 [Biomphalaria glabrata]|uniref:Tetraspanin n=2 Tax=Biomphalaria glabrata TaxID=6526 RepID=A0A9U8DVP0_BIOGL|nr:tetraspanin-4-like isoform X1 [Biomphalaria glabrata]
MADCYQHELDIDALPPPGFNDDSSSPPPKMGREKKSFSAVKYIFFGFNVFVWLLGCGILAVAIWLWASRGPSTAVIPTYSFLSASSLCIISSVIILIIGFMGCCGAFLENQCLLIGYFILVLLVFALEITAGSLGFVMKDKIRDVIYKELASGIKYDYRTEVQLNDQSKNNSFYDRDARGWSTSLDTLQRDLQCCGVDNHTDWYNIQAWPNEQKVPDSCCIHPSINCGFGDPSLWHQRGCLEEVEYWFTRNMYILGVTGVTIGSVQILIMVAAVAQFCYIRSKRFPL